MEESHQRVACSQMMTAVKHQDRVAGGEMSEPDQRRDGNKVKTPISLSI